MSDEKVYIKQLKTGNNLGAFKVTADSLTAPTTSLISPNELTAGYSVGITSFVVGSDRLDDDSSVITKDNRMLFDKVKGAFRAGTANDSQWDNANRGTYSIALGRNSTASGSNSFAVGNSNTASGEYSTAIGRSNDSAGGESVSIGTSNAISFSSNNSMVIGTSNTIGAGTYACVFGNENTTGIYNYSTAIGLNNTASGINAIAIGHSNLVYNSTTGTTPVAIGQDNTININSQWGIAIGKNNTTSTGNSPILIGNTNSSGSGHNSVAIGQSNTASGGDAVAIGQSNTASSGNAVAIGQSNTASSGNALALGTNATVSQSFSFLWNGDNTSGTTPVPHTLLSSEVSGSSTFWCSGTGTFRINFGLDSPLAAVSSATGYAWASSSDINLKENLVEHTYSDTLDKIMQIPIYTYNFKKSASGITCIGPVAQDFNRLFPSDKDQLNIADRDMCGVALAGVKGVKLGLDSLSNSVNTRFATVTTNASAQQSQINTLIASLTTANTQITTLSTSLTAAIVRITALESDVVVLKSKVK